MLRGKLHGDPTLPIERARKRRRIPDDVQRATRCAAIIAAQDELRDRIGVRLLLNYGLRKGALKAVQFKHFDHHRKRLTVFTKGEKVRELPIPDPAFWFDLERLIIDIEAQPHALPDAAADDARLAVRAGKAVESGVRQVARDQPMGDHGLHDWWYALPRAGRDRRAGRRRAASGCTRPATPPASASSTRPGT